MTDSIFADTVSVVNEPIEVEIINRGEGAATGIGLVLGFVGLVVTLCLIAVASLVLIVAFVPTVLVLLILWTVRTTVRLQARQEEWMDELGIAARHE